MARNFKEEIVDRIIDLSERHDDMLDEIRKFTEMELNGVDDAIELLWCMTVNNKRNFSTSNSKSAGFIKCYCRRDCKKWCRFQLTYYSREVANVYYCKSCRNVIIEGHYEYKGQIDYKYCKYCIENNRVHLGDQW